MPVEEKDGQIYSTYLPYVIHNGIEYMDPRKLCKWLHQAKAFESFSRMHFTMHMCIMIRIALGRSHLHDIDIYKYAILRLQPHMRDQRTPNETRDASPTQLHMRHLQVADSFRCELKRHPCMFKRVGICKPRKLEPRLFVHARAVFKFIHRNGEANNPAHTSTAGKKNTKWQNRHNNKERAGDDPAVLANLANQQQAAARRRYLKRKVAAELEKTSELAPRAPYGNAGADRRVIQCSSPALAAFKDPTEIQVMNTSCYAALNPTAFSDQANIAITFLNAVTPCGVVCRFMTQAPS